MYAIFLIEFGLKPWELDELPLTVVELLNPISLILRGGDQGGVKRVSQGGGPPR
jgi:hypothetical protein